MTRHPASEQAVPGLVQSAVTDLCKAKDLFYDPERALDLSPNLEIGSVARFLRLVDLRWPRSAGQVGGEDKLFPGSDHAASFRLDTVAGACPGDGVEPTTLYASSGVRPASEECGRCVL